MERWRSLFGKSGTDIWTLIEQAITLAATDYPSEFKKRRSDIAETLFSRSLLQPLLSDGGSAGEEDAATRASVSMITHVTSNMLEDGEVRMKEDNALVPRIGNNKWEWHQQRTCGSGNGNVIDNATRSNTSSITYNQNNSKDNNSQFSMPEKDMALERRSNCDQRNANHPSLRTNQSMSSASTVTLNSKERGSNQSINDSSQKIHRHHDQNGDGDRGSDDKSITKELHHIKDVLQDGDNLEEGVILDCMEKLEYMQLSVEMLKSTEIGKDVNGFRKHASKHVRAVVKRLVRNWKEMVDAWAGNVQPDGITPSTDLSGCKGLPGSCKDQEPENSENPENKKDLPVDTSVNDQALGNAFSPPPNLFSFLEDEILTGVGGNACKTAKTEGERVAKSHSFSSSVQARSSLSEDKKVKTGCSLVFKVPKRKDITSEDSDIGSTGKKLDTISRNHDRRWDDLGSLPKTTDRLSSGKPSSSLKAKVGTFQATDNSNGNLTLRFANADKKAKAGTLNNLNSHDKAQVEKHSANKRKLHDGYQQPYDVKRQRGI